MAEEIRDYEIEGEEPEDEIEENEIDLAKYIFTPEAQGKNLAEMIDEEDLNVIGADAWTGYDVDKESCNEWEKRTTPAVELAMLIYEQKNEPFEESANVKYPILTVGAIQFSARAYPNIIKGKNVVRVKIIGKDEMPSRDPQNPNPIKGAKAKIGQRISTHMSYQLLEQMEEWETDLDKALVCLPVIGEDWKKTYYDPELRRNVSTRVQSNNMVMNYWAKSADSAQRLTERIWLYPNQIEEHKRSGFYLDVDIPQGYETVEQDAYKPKTGGQISDPRDPDAPKLFLEQHCFLDMDDDGYKEPYIVTIHNATKKVMRIVPRFDLKGVSYNKGVVSKIKAVGYYTQTVFFPSPDGGSRGMGLGNLITPINETVNTTINQLLDSGTLHNNQSGFIAAGGMPGKGKGGGKMSLALGEFKRIPVAGDDIRKSVMGLPTKEPSIVLFQLLGLMIESGKEVSSVSSIMSGEAPGPNTAPTTVTALIEQGLKVFSAVFKRVHRGLKSEYKKLYRLNSLNLDQAEYVNILDDPAAIAQIDYNTEGMDIVPVSDPNEVTDIQKMMKAETLKGMIGQGFNDLEVRKRYLETMEFEDPEKLMPPPAPAGPPPEFQLELDKLKLDRDKFQWKMVVDRSVMVKNEMAALKSRASAIKDLADAEAAEEGPQLEMYKAQLQDSADQMQNYQKELEFLDKSQERIANAQLQQEQRPSDNTVPGV